jgi:spermidine synthase
LIPWTLLDTAKIPDDGGELRLKQRGQEFSIMLGTNELMNSRLSGSERALATLSCEKVRDRKSPHLLIGGLGMGFTLRAALAELGEDAKVTVAELVPTVITWARGPMASVFEGCLDDPRVAIHEGDVRALIASRTVAYDAILLDVDNGPDGITHGDNDGLYDFKGLRASRDALRAGGVLAVWSAHPDRDFTRRLTGSGFAVEEVKVRANGKSGARHVIWIAVKAAR